MNDDDSDVYNFGADDEMLSSEENQPESIYCSFVSGGDIEMSSSSHMGDSRLIDDSGQSEDYPFESSSSDFHKSDSTSSNLDSIDGSSTTNSGDKQNRAVNRKKRLIRKAPNAPKRFKSAYICYVVEKMDEVKSMLSSDVKVTDAMKVLAQMWRELPPQKRAEYNKIAEDDKSRYFSEMKTYTGPMHVPNKRQKKPPGAPKRAMSAFLSFSQQMRPQVRAEYPHLKNTDISGILAQMWKSGSEEIKKPHINRELHDRELYHEDMTRWKEEVAKAKDNSSVEDEATLDFMSDMWCSSSNEQFLDDDSWMVNGGSDAIGGESINSDWIAQLNSARLEVPQADGEQRGAKFLPSISAGNQLMTMIEQQQAQMSKLASAKRHQIHFASQSNPSSASQYRSNVPVMYMQQQQDQVEQFNRQFLNQQRQVDQQNIISSFRASEGTTTAKQARSQVSSKKKILPPQQLQQQQQHQLKQLQHLQQQHHYEQQQQQQQQQHQYQHQYQHQLQHHQQQQQQQQQLLQHHHQQQAKATMKSANIMQPMFFSKFEFYKQHYLQQAIYQKLQQGVAFKESTDVCSQNQKSVGLDQVSGSGSPARGASGISSYEFLNRTANTRIKQQESVSGFSGNESERILASLCAVERAGMSNCSTSFGSNFES